MSKISLLISILILVSMSNVSNMHIFCDTANSSSQQLNNLSSSFTPNISDEISNNLHNSEFGVWIHTKYNGVSNSTQLDIDLAQFTLMLSSLAWKYYDITFEQQHDARIGIQFSRTQIYVYDESDPYINVLQTQLDFTTSCETDKEVEVALEMRFPFSSITKTRISESDQLDITNEIIIHKLTKISKIFSEKTHSKFLKMISEKLNNLLINTPENNINPQPVPTTSESYFGIRTGFSSPNGEKLPAKVLTRFFSGRDKLSDPRVLRMNIAPDINGESALTFFNSYFTVDESENEAFSRTFSIQFEPAVELQITSILRELKIRYDFGRSAAVSTKISLQALGGLLSGINQHFMINPLPEYMSFDLTVFGERSFKYEADRQYSVTYTADSQQNGNLVTLDLKNLPLTMTVEWGLDVSLMRTSGSGLIDLDMSNDIDEVSLSLLGSPTPFIRITNFPKQIRLEGLIDVPNLNGYIRASKISDSTTTISVPITFNKWLITGNLELYNGYGQVSFNLPGEDNNQVSVGFDTDNNALLGFDFVVVDTQTSNQVLYVSIEKIAADNFLLSFDNSGGEIADFHVSGAITELTNIRIRLNYQGFNFDISGTWMLRQNGSFSIEASKTIDLSLDDINTGDFSINGNLLVNPGGYVKVEWQRGQTGYFIFSTHGITAEVDVTFGEKNSSNIYFYGKVSLTPGATIKFSWDWRSTGYFMVFSNLFKELDVEAYINYSPEQQQYQYGFKAHATDVMFTRTLKWDVGSLRFWWLGDEPVPSQWDIWILWDYGWHEV